MEVQIFKSGQATCLARWITLQAQVYEMGSVYGFLTIKTIFSG